MPVAAAPRMLLSLAVVMTTAAYASASILDEFNLANLIADFQFDDAIGTPIESTLNSVDPLATWDTDVDFGGAATNGAGQFDAAGKANTDFGSVYVDTPGVTTGVVYGLFDVAWAFDEGVYDPAQDEEFRLTLIQFDPRSTFVTAETFFTRTSATEVQLVGNAVGTGSVDTSTITLGSSGDLLTIVKADLDAETIELFYSADDGASFLSAGVGTLDPTRGVDSIRLVLNEDFSNDVMTIERFAYAHIPEPMTPALLAIGATLYACASRRS